MRVAFAGTPDFAAVALAAVFEAGHDVPLVLTQPDRPAGRGLKLQPSAVKTLARSVRALRALPTWNSTKVVKAKVRATASP